MKKIEYIGKKFNRLTIIKEQSSYYCGKQKVTRVLCICECGKEKLATLSHIKANATKSCGCLIEEYWKNPNKKTKALKNKGEAGLNKFISAYKQGAKVRNLDWKLTQNEVRILTSNICNYCGREPSNISKSKSGNVFGDYIYNGIDRIDNTKGYILNNCVTCCEHCNRAKMSLSVEEFKILIDKIYNYFIVGNK